MKIVFVDFTAFFDFKEKSLTLTQNIFALTQKISNYIFYQKVLILLIFLKYPFFLIL